MSMMLMVQAMKAKVGNPLRKLVLIKLADNANDDGECWPSYQHIADQCEMSKSSVMRHIGELISAGFLSKEYRYGGPKGNQSNVYILTIPSVSVTPPLVSERDHPSVSVTPPPSVSVTPRTSHSFEPVIEPREKPKNRFSPPSLQEIQAYCLTRGNDVDPQRFHDFYASKGWMVGKSKMQDWQAAVRTWEKSSAPKPQPSSEMPLWN